MADKYNIAKVCCDLIDQANGLPKGTTKPGTLTLEEVGKQAGEMARAIVILQWGITGCLGLMTTEHEDVNHRNIRRFLPHYDYAWLAHSKVALLLGTMIDAGCEPDVMVQQDVAYAIFQCNAQQGATALNNDEKRNLWEIVRANHWHVELVKRMVKRWRDAKRLTPDRVKEIMQLCIMAADRKVRLGKCWASKDLPV